MLTWNQIQAFEEYRADLVRQMDMERLAQLARTPVEPAPARRSALAWLGKRLAAWGESLEARTAAVGRPRDDKRPQRARLVIARLIVFSGEVYRLPADARELRVVSGRAWITHGGRDLVLKRCEAATLDRTEDLALVSALGRRPLVLEVLGRRTHRTSGRLASRAAPALLSV